MEYKIISGEVEEVRQTMMTPDRHLPKRRGVRVRGNSTMRKILANEREAVKRLARIINANFRAGDLWLTLRYSDGRLPASKEEAEILIAKFLRDTRKRFYAATGRKLRYILVTSQKSPRDGESARIHHHLVMDALAYETICQLWPKDEITYRYMDGRKDYTGIARYMIGNADGGNYRKRWSTSKGLEKPTYTIPMPVARPSRESLPLPVGAIYKAHEDTGDEDIGTWNHYIRYVRKAAHRQRREEKEIIGRGYRA